LPDEEAGMRAAWQGRERVGQKTAQPSSSAKPPENIRPASALSVPQTNQEKAGQSAEESSDKDAKTDKEGRAARWLRKKQAAARQARAKEYAAKGAAGAGKGTINRYKQVKNLIRLIRAGSLAGTSLGDIFFSLSALFLSLVGEWLLSKFIPAYHLFPKDDPFAILDKALWYVGWAVVGSALLIITLLVVLMYYISQDPANALKFFLF